MEGLGYKVCTTVLDSSSFGVPQQRKRLFLVSIRGDSVRHQIKWPSNEGSKPPEFNMDDFLDPIVPGDRPGRMPSSDRGRRHCKAAYRKVFANGINPQHTSIGGCGLLRSVPKRWCAHCKDVDSESGEVGGLGVQHVAAAPPVVS